MSFRFQVSGFRFQVSGFRFQVSGFRFQVSGFRFTFGEGFVVLPNFKLETSNLKLNKALPNLKLETLNLKLIVLFLVFISLNACRSHKKAVVSASTTTEETTFYTSCYPIESLYVPSCKLDVSFGDQSLSLNGSIYIRPDSIFYFRGRLLIDVMRGAIYRDSFIIINYVDRVCYKGKNEYLQKITGYPVNPETLLILFTADRCEKAYQYNSPQQQAVFNVTYSDYHQYPQFNLPTGFDISAYNGEIPVRIKANFREILINQPQEVNISVPSSYEVVVLQ